MITLLLFYCKKARKITILMKNKDKNWILMHDLHEKRDFFNQLLIKKDKKCSLKIIGTAWKVKQKLN